MTNGARPSISDCGSETLALVSMSAFRENEIDIDILAELTEPHLEKLGVPLGHRIRLLKAISNLEATDKSAVWVPRRCRRRMCSLPSRRYPKPLASAGMSR